MNGEYKIDTQQEPELKQLLPFWRNIFETESEEDERTPPSKNPPILELESPITVDEVNFAKKSSKKDTAPGLDNISVQDLIKIPSLELAQRFNVWLLGGDVPRRCKECVTTLIPKQNGATRPEDFRPMTMAPTLLRLFHRILSKRMMALLPFDENQKAFRKSDGVAHNLITIQSLMDNHKKQLEPLNAAFLDVKKAFDSVNHSSLFIACKRIGVPETTLRYIKQLYYESRTKLRVQGETSDEIIVKRGIKQGDPLSVPLFLAIMDWAVADMDKKLGVSIGNCKINHLAFADDLVILASTKKGLQTHMDILESNLQQSGMKFNQKKCSSFCITTDGEDKKWLIDPNPFLKCNNEIIPATTIGSFYKYLGIQIGCMDNSTFVTQVLERKLSYVTKAPLKPRKRLYTLINHMLPSLFYPLTFMSTSKNFLRSLDIRIRAAFRKWLRIPKDVPVSFFHTISKMGGLGVPQSQYTIPPLKTARLNKFADTTDTTSVEIISNNALPKFSRNWERPVTVAGETVTNKNELDNITAQMLYRSIDGKSLRQASEAKENGVWINNGTLLLSGRDYIGALSLEAVTSTVNLGPLGVMRTPRRCVNAVGE